MQKIKMIEDIRSMFPSSNTSGLTELAESLLNGTLPDASTEGFDVLNLDC